MKIIINADDFGMNANVNIAIKKLFELGMLDRCSLMVNMQNVEELIEDTKRDALFFDRIGLHINLTEGFPLTQHIKTTFFCDKKGIMTLNNVNLFNRLYINNFTKRAIKEEINAQMLKFIALGLPLRHADSHNYSNVDWSILKIVIEEAVKNGFTSLRIAKNILSDENHGLKYIYRRVANYPLKHFNQRYNSSESTQYFGSLFDVFKWIKEGKNFEGTVEMMVHPTIDNEGLICDNYTGEKLIEPLSYIRKLTL